MSANGQLNGPYIGITGFMSRTEVMAVLRELRASWGRSQRRLMVGVLANRHTFDRGDFGRPGRYPKLRDIPGIFYDDPRLLGLVHYSQGRGKPEHLINAVFQLHAECCEVPGFHGFQLNAPWPQPVVLEAVRQLIGPGMSLVLQVGPQAIAAEACSPKRIAARIASEYDGHIDHVLLDGSGGEGRVMDPRFIRSCLFELRNTGVRAGFVIAGGLSAGQMSLVQASIRGFPDPDRVSMDAEGGLRDLHDRLVITKSAAYVKAALKELE